jgi:hypothetical protein
MLLDFSALAKRKVGVDVSCKQGLHFWLIAGFGSFIFTSHLFSSTEEFRASVPLMPLRGFLDKVFVEILLPVDYKEVIWWELHLQSQRISRESIPPDLCVDMARNAFRCAFTREATLLH